MIEKMLLADIDFNYLSKTDNDQGGLDSQQYRGKYVCNWHIDMFEYCL